MALERIHFSFPLEAETDMTDKQYTAVKVSDSFKCDTAASTEDGTIAGIVVNNPKAGMAATVARDGIVKIKVADGATITAGKGVAITNGEASGDGTFGVALETVSGPALGTILI